MTLLLDLGNTALKWALSESYQTPHTIVHARSGGFANQLALTLGEQHFARAYGCSVAPHEVTDICTSVFTGMRRPVTWLRSQESFRGPFTLKNGYADPLQLGSDRWHAALGAVAFSPAKPLVVIHSGTAITVDSIIPEDEDSYRFLGGRIAPGVVLMHAALVEKIRSLPREYSHYEDFPKDSTSAITTGIIDAHLGIIERALHAMQGLGHDPVILLAGGAANLCAPYLKAQFPGLIQKHNLVLAGIALRAGQEGG